MSHWMSIFPGAMQSRVERFRAEMKLSEWLLVLPDWGLRTGGELHWSWGRKLRHINTECGAKRVRLPLPCVIFIGGGYVFQEAEQRRGKSRRGTFPVFGAENRVPQLAAKICYATRE